MNHNKRKQMKLAISYLEQILTIHKKDGSALPYSVVEHVTAAEEILLKDKMMLNKFKYGGQSEATVDR